MADDLEAGTCGGGRSVAFDMAAAVPCSTMIADAGGGIGFSWMASVLVHGTARSCEESSAFGSSITFQDSTPKFQHADVGPPLNADSSLQLPVFGIGTPSMDWTQDFVSSARAETSLHAMLQEDLSSFFGQHQSIGSNQVGMGIKSSTMNLEDTNQKFLSYYHQLSYGNESGDVDVSSYSFLPISYGCPPSTSMLQGLFEAETKLQQPVYKSPRMDYRGRAKTNSNGARESYSSSSKGPSTELALKRLRTETPLPLPTFKVRKEKLGDRITALQQLVSPFGKTDTASVLHEAIEYIKFLHDQVGVLSTPYLKSVDPMQHQQASDKSDDGDGIKQELRSRGLCLVPIASTYPVASETAAGRTLR